MKFVLKENWIWGLQPLFGKCNNFTPGGVKYLINAVVVDVICNNSKWIFHVSKETVQ